MNRAITFKFANDSLVTFLCVVFGSVGFVMLFVWAMQNLGTQLMEFLSSVGFLRRMLEMAYGISLEGDMSSNVLYAIAFMHPIVLALGWGFVIATATRTTVGEFEAGTADFLLTLPVTRVSVYGSSTVAWAILGSLASLSPMFGVWLGSQLFEPTEPIVLRNFLAPSANFLVLNLVVGGISMLASCLVDRRAHAIAIVVAVLLASLAMNFLEPFLTVIERIQFLNLLNYYQPSDAVRTGDWPWSHLLVLLVVGTIAWSIGLWQYCRKDVPAP